MSWRRCRSRPPLWPAARRRARRPPNTRLPAAPSRCTSSSCRSPPAICAAPPIVTQVKFVEDTAFIMAWILRSRFPVLIRLELALI